MTKERIIEPNIYLCPTGTYRVRIKIGSTVFFDKSGISLKIARRLRDQHKALADKAKPKRTMARILEVVHQHQPLSRRRVVELTGLKENTVQSTISKMMARGMVHEVRPAIGQRLAGVGMARLLRAGPAPDGKAKAPSVRAVRIEAVRAYLAEFPNSTTQDIADAKKLSIHSIRDVLNEMRAATPKQVYVSGFSLDHSEEGGAPRYCFSLGDQEDKKHRKGSAPRARRRRAVLGGRLRDHVGNPFAAAMVPLMMMRKEQPA